MQRISHYRYVKEIINSDLPLEIKIHIFEGDISELIYRLWCRLTGGRFERRRKKRRNSCVLVTKRGFHPISNFLARRKRRSIAESELEVYERDCPGSSLGTQTTMNWYWWFENPSPCKDCGRPFKVQDDDTKIVGKFRV
jgi:hypothetical protein